MACSSPKFAYTLIKEYKNGNRRPRFDLDAFPEIQKAVYDYNCNNPDWRQLQDFAPPGVWLHRISCGHCLACRMARSREWADRACMEAIAYPMWSNWFVTLTFDNEHLIYKTEKRIYFKGDLLSGDDLDDIPMIIESGQGHFLQERDFIADLPTVDADQISMFMKRLRARYQAERGHSGVKFMGCAEYGDRSLRPHYHLILFNAPLYKNQLKPSPFWKPGSMPLYEVDLFSSCWHDGTLKGGKDGNLIGHVVVGRFSYNTAAYVARYITKKQFGKGATVAYDEHGIDPVSMRVSLRPGIGSDFMRANWLQLTEKGIYLPTDNPDKPLQVHMPHRMYQALCSPDFEVNEETGEVFFPPGALDRMYELMFIKCDQEEARQLVRDTMRQQLSISEEDYLCNVLPVQLEARQKNALNRERFS